MSRYHKTHAHVIEQVPVDYYQSGVKKNVLQRIWHTQKLRVILGLLPKSPKAILDVGCASGWFLSKISERHPKSSCHGIDVYTEGISYAKKTYRHIEFKVGDAHAIPYKAEKFDVVVCTEVLEHVDDPKDVLLEIKRVLKKNGEAIIELDTGSLLFTIVWYLWRKYQGKVWNDAHLHIFSVKKLEQLIIDCGFEVERKQVFNMGMAMAFLIKKP